MALKTIFDYFLALLLLPILLPLILMFALVSTLDTGSFGIFKQNRIGKGGKPFEIFKLRTIKGKSDSYITTSKTHNITRWGNFLRKTKLDETPQLFNILMGQMSFVGPRPDVPGYADCLQGEDRIILSVKPGVTGPAQLKYKDEDEVLVLQTDPKQYNDEVLWPKKVAINRDYVENLSFLTDLKYIFKTVF